MREPTAQDFDRAHDLRKNWQAPPEITPQQRADVLLWIWQTRRNLPPAQRLGDNHASQ